MSMPIINPSIEEIKAVQREHGVSWFEARKEVERKQILRALDNAETVDDLRSVLYFLLNNTRM